MRVHDENASCTVTGCDVCSKRPPVLSPAMWRLLHDAGYYPVHRDQVGIVGLFMHEIEDWLDRPFDAAGGVGETP